MITAPPVLTAGRLAALVGGELRGESSIAIAGTAPLDRAGPGDCSFLGERRYLDAYRATGASLVLVTPDLADAPTACAARILVDDVDRAFERAQHALMPAPAAPVWGVHPSAHLGRGVTWTGRLSIGPHAVVGPGVKLGDDCIVEAGASIGAGARLGKACHVHHQATVLPGAILGARVIVRPGARVGGDGFAFALGDGRADHRVHTGRCVVGDDVEIGSNATVDRGRVGDTVVGDGTKLDAHVHVAHNVRVGRRCLIMAQVGIAGSSAVGDDALLGGQAGITDHVRVGAGARVGAQAGIIGDIDDGSTVSGYPARNHRSVLRQVAALRRLEPLVDRLERLVAQSDD